MYLCDRLIFFAPPPPNPAWLYYLFKVLSNIAAANIGYSITYCKDTLSSCQSYTRSMHIHTCIHTMCTSIHVYILCAHPYMCTYYVHIHTCVHTMCTSIHVYILCAHPYMYTSIHVYILCTHVYR